MANDIKLREFDSYNPDFMLGCGTWIEVTLSEEKAYKKLFVHGHQAPHLRVFWLDEDSGHYKSRCAPVTFPNATVARIDTLLPFMKESATSETVIEHILQLRKA